MQLPVRVRISRLVTSLVYQLKHDERRRSPALAKAATLKKINHYQKMLVTNNYGLLHSASVVRFSLLQSIVSELVVIE